MQSWPDWGGGDPKGSRCRGEELQSCRQREPEHRGTGAVRRLRSAKRWQGQGENSLCAPGLSSEHISDTAIFAVFLKALLSAKQPFLQPSIPLLLPQAPALTASISEPPINRLPPEDGAHIPQKNRGQALHGTVHFGATPGRNPATLYQNHQSKSHS